jgi:hypothetical protein
MQILYTFYCGTSNVPTEGPSAEAIIAAALLAFNIDAFTIVSCKGYWKGKPEQSAQVQLVSPEPIQADTIAQALARELSEECVLVTDSYIGANLIAA